MACKYFTIETQVGGANYRPNPTAKKADGLCSVAVIAPNGAYYYTLIKPDPNLNYDAECLASQGLTLEQMQKEGISEKDALHDLNLFINTECPKGFVAGADVQKSLDFLSESGKRVGGWDGGFFERGMYRRSYEIMNLARTAHDAGIVTLPIDPQKPRQCQSDREAIFNSLGLEGKVRNVLDACDKATKAMHILQGAIAKGRGENAGAIVERPNEYFILDTETGGTNQYVDPSTGKADGLCSVAVVAANGNSYYTLVKPDPNLNYNPRALEVNGLTLEQMEMEGIPETEAICALAEFIKRECPNALIAGANIQFDLKFLSEAGKRVGGDGGEFFIGIDDKPSYEVQNLALIAHDAGHIKLPPGRKVPEMVQINLDAVLHSLKMKRDGDTHDALEDCKKTGAAMYAMQALLRGEPPASTDDGGLYITPDYLPGPSGSGNRIITGFAGKER